MLRIALIVLFLPAVLVAVGAGVAALLGISIVMTNTLASTWLFIILKAIFLVLMGVDGYQMWKNRL